MRFGYGDRKALTGTGLYVRIFQIMSLLPPIYIFIVSGYPAVGAKKGIFSVLFDIGVSALPRAETAAVSYLYRLTSSEILVHFAFLIVAFVFGIAAGKLLTGSEKTGRTARIVFAVLICLDILVRFVPGRFNKAFGIPAAAAGLVIRLVCLVLVLLDLRAGKKESAGKTDR